MLIQARSNVRMMSAPGRLIGKKTWKNICTASIEGPFVHNDPLVLNMQLVAACSLFVDEPEVWKLRPPHLVD